MALFKVKRGNRAELPQTKTDGYAYFCTDDGSFWIDYADANGTLHRKQIDAGSVAGHTVEVDVPADAKFTDTTYGAAGTAFGLVKSGGDVTISGGVIQVNDDSHNHVIGNVDGLQDALNGKASASHNHDDRYYTESEIDSKIDTLNTAIDGKADASHSHNDKYYTEAEIDTKMQAVSTTYETKADADSKLTSAKSYAKDYADGVKNDLLNGAGDAYDTLKELGDLIDENTDAIDALNAVAAGKADKSHTHDDRYYTETEIDSKLSAKADSSALTNKAEVFWAVYNTTTLEELQTAYNAGKLLKLKFNNNWIAEISFAANDGSMFGFAAPLVTPGTTASAKVVPSIAYICSAGGWTRIVGSPAAHKATHATGGSDALTPADIGAMPAVTGQAGQVIGFGADGNAVAQDPQAAEILEENQQLDQRFWRGTREEYDAIAAKNDNITYIIEDETDESNILNITNGGTGASTAAAARANLDVYSKEETEQSVEDLTQNALSQICVQKLASQSLSADSTQLTMSFSGVDLSQFSRMELILNNVSTTYGGTQQGLQLLVNGDSTSGHYGEMQSTEIIDTDALIAGYVFGQYRTSSQLTLWEQNGLVICNGSTFLNTNDGSTGNSNTVSHTFWKQGGLGSVTSLTLKCPNGNLKSSSSAVLYGWKK